MLVPLLALVFVAATDLVRLRRVEATTALAQEPTRPDAGSPAGLPGGGRELIVPEHNSDSYHWIAQTQQMLARGEWRVRHIDYENAPFGRDVFAPSPYRWWLGVVAWGDQVLTGHPPGPAVEKAALLADPLLHLLLLAGATAFVAWRFGPVAATVMAVGLAALFPFAGGFISGAPDDHGLAQVAALWSVLLLLAGLDLQPGPPPPARAAGRWFFAAGVVGGLGLWFSVARGVPLVAGLALGALFATWLRRRRSRPDDPAAAGPLPWRLWALGGAVTTLLAYLAEFFPAHLDTWQLRVIHPVYGLSWLGAGELLARTADWLEQRKASWRPADVVQVVLAAAAVAATPVALWRNHTLGFLEPELAGLRLVRLPGGATALNSFAWLSHDGVTPMSFSTLLPFVLAAPVLWLLLRRATEAGLRFALALTAGPLLVALGFAGRQLNWWNEADAAFLVWLAVAATAWRGAVTRWFWPGFVALLLLPGAIQLVPRAGAELEETLSQAEFFGLIERDLARWLALHAGTAGAVVLAPHNETNTLYYYGGLPGLATLGWENQDGLGAAVRIVSASTPEEAKELIDRRHITHIVMPSWDSYLDLYARIGMGQLDGTFLNNLDHWKLPPWLKPVPYQLPTIKGFEGQAVTILEVVEDQDDAAALSRVAEYFVEMNKPDLAASVAQSLRRFPADLGALVARAQVEYARNDPEAFARTVELLKPRLVGAGPRALPWDRRASLAVVLARSKNPDAAREQVRRCYADVDEPKLRSLSTGALYRLQVLGKAYGLTISDPHLRGLARDLLPAELRDRL